MAPHDAFGREIGEDVPSAPTATTPPPAETPGGGMGPAGRTVASLAVALVIVAGIVALVVVGLGGKESSSSTSVGTRIELPTAAPQGTAPPSPKPAAQRSLIDRDALASALRKLRGRGRLRLVRVARDRVDAQLVTRAGALRNVQVTADGAVRDFGTAGSSAGGLPTIPFNQVDAAAPARIVRVAARRAGRKPSRVDYLVLLMLPTGQSWNVYFKPDGLHFMADRHGTSLRRL
jgi:hypothetical protein